ncbi:hypothetical protein N7532_001202 [Penicillium argentinense]|uniref:Uncharacterized protein n=1 Tax=Penicillium argentinense TaxID=1131581 RepID=A0A9W9G254_9EURO|nr:uncharacterized protein N7532_001202 [Penicillium argentinense]KAJ5110667.1 hypothetical protein N7532_001202 [Penicillium argentinense]
MAYPSPYSRKEQAGTGLVIFESPPWLQPPGESPKLLNLQHFVAHVEVIHKAEQTITHEAPHKAIPDEPDIETPERRDQHMDGTRYETSNRPTHFTIAWSRSIVS